MPDPKEIDRLVKKAVEDAERQHGVKLDDKTVQQIREQTRKYLETGETAVSGVDLVFYGADGALIGNAARTGTLLQGAVGRVAIPITVAFGAYDGYQAYSRGDRAGVGEAAGGVGGAILGGAGAGFAAGTFFPGLGNLAGFCIGAVGGGAGYYLGKWFGRKAGEAMTPPPRLISGMRVGEAAGMAETEALASANSGRADLSGPPRGQLAAQFQSPASGAPQHDGAAAADNDAKNGLQPRNPAQGLTT